MEFRPGLFNWAFLFCTAGLLVVSQQPYAWPSSLWWDGFTAAGAPHALVRPLPQSPK